MTRTLSAHVGVEDEVEYRRIVFGDENLGVEAVTAGLFQGSDSAGGGYQTVFAEVPLREVTTYARTLSTMTGGQGSL